jgi:hypothetical protein
MLKNDIEARATAERLAQLEAALLNLSRDAGADPPRSRQLEIDAVTALAADLRAELSEYEAQR